MKIFVVCIAVAFTISQYSVAQSQTPGGTDWKISDLTPIPIHPGINVIPDFMPTGRSATVILAWRDNGDAGGSDLAMIMDQEAAGGSWEVVSIDPLGNDAGEPNVLYDDPHTGEDDVRTFRFARGKVNGASATLLLTATRAQGASIPAPSLVTFKAFQLVHEGAITVGVTPDYFSPIATSISTTMYCNADKALSDHFDLPLRTSYGGPNTPDGCPQTPTVEEAAPAIAIGAPQIALSRARLIKGLSSSGIGKSVNEIENIYSGLTCSGDPSICDFGTNETPQALCPAAAPCENLSLFTDGINVTGYAANVDEQDWKTLQNAANSALGPPQYKTVAVITIRSDYWTWSLPDGDNLVFTATSGTNIYGASADSHSITVSNDRP